MSSWYDARERLVRDLSCGSKRIYLHVSIRRVLCPVCQAVKRESLEWLAANPHYTKRFVRAVGRRCREATIKDVAEDFFKESFDQFLTYSSETWAWKFFNNGKDSLKWQRLKPLGEFSVMVERHWDGIVAHLNCPVLAMQSNTARHASITLDCCKN